MFNDKSVKLIVIKISPAVAVDEIENTWKYSGPLSGSLLFSDCLIIACAVSPVNEPPLDVDMLIIGSSSNVSETSIRKVYSPRTKEVPVIGTLSSSWIA